jgi:hypothetical protein
MDLLEGPALHLAKQHKRADFSDPQFAHRISSFIHGSSHGVTPSMVAELGADGYWQVFEAIASGTRTIEGLVDAGISREVAQEAVEELLQRELIAESDADELYAAYDVVTVEPYPVPRLRMVPRPKNVQGPSRRWPDGSRRSPGEREYAVSQVLPRRRRSGID